MGDQILYSLDDRIARITLNRPEKLNAFFGTMRSDLLEALNRAAGESRAIVITGAGRAFCAGGDVQVMSELRERGEREDTAAFRELVEAGIQVTRRLAALSVPTIAAVNGVAAGAGFSLALACDFRVVSEEATLGASFVKIGLSADWGGSYFLTRMLGRARAIELLVTGRMLKASEAEALGLVTKLVAAESVLDTSLSLARSLAETAPKSVAQLKRLVVDAEQLSLDECLELEQRAQLACFRSSDALEGIRAFQQKRKPEFKGK